MVIYLYLVILIVICIITGIITTVVEHKRLIPKKKKSLINVLEAPSLVYQSIDSHISKESSIISIIDNNSAVAKNNIYNNTNKRFQIQLFDDKLEKTNNRRTSNVEELI